jgi:chromosome partitioning protein
MIVIAIVNQKGGVGKTTTAVNLGVGLAHSAQRVLLIDLDPQAHATQALGVNTDALGVEQTAFALFQYPQCLPALTIATAEPKLKLLPSTIRLARAVESLYGVLFREVVLSKALQTVRGEFDYVLLDCAPTFGVLATNALVAADKILIPTQLARMPLSGLSDLLDTLHAVKQEAPHDWRVLFTMVHGYGKERQQAAARLLEPMRERILRTQIRRTEAIERSQPLEEDEGISAVILEKGSANGAARDYRHLVKEVLETWPA